MRRIVAFVVLAWIALVSVSSSSGSIALTGSDYLVRAEGAFNAGSRTYSVPLNVAASRRLVVAVAAQYAMDFGIIPAADLEKWRRLENPRFVFRLSGQTNTRYITLSAGSYYVVARDLNGGAISNGYAFKIRRLLGSSTDGGITRNFVSNQVSNGVIAPQSWNGFAFSHSAATKMRIDALFSRGLDRQAYWQILKESEYLKFRSGRSYQALVSGTNPKRPAFEFVPTGGPYYFILINRGVTYSAYSVTRELYR